MTGYVNNRWETSSRSCARRGLFVLAATLLFGTAMPRVCNGSEVLWNTFHIYDFSSWEDGLHLIEEIVGYGPGIGILGNGDVSATGSFNDGGGSYWVYSFFGDALYSFEDYLNREMAADVEYTASDIIIAGANFNGHEDMGSTGHTYLAVIGFKPAQVGEPATPETAIPYYGWVELDGMYVVSSAITGAGPLVIGTGYIIPEPTGGALFLLGAAALLLRRRRKSKRGRS